MKNETRKIKEVMTKNFDSSGIETAEFVVNMSTIILIVFAVLIVVLTAVLFAKILPCKTLRDKIKGKLEAAKKNFMWNGFIRS